MFHMETQNNSNKLLTPKTNQRTFIFSVYHALSVPSNADSTETASTLIAYYIGRYFSLPARK